MCVIIDNAYNESNKSLNEKILDFINKFINDENYRNQILKDYKVSFIFLFIETCIFVIPCIITLFILNKALCCLEAVSIDKLFSNTWGKIAAEYYNKPLFNAYKSYPAQKKNTNSTNDVPFDTFKTDDEASDPDLQNLKKNHPVHDQFLELYLMYLYKDLIKNEAQQSLFKRIALLPVYITILVIEVARSLLITALIVAHVLAWAATVLVTGLVLIAPPLIFKKLFCKKSSDNATVYSEEEQNTGPSHAGFFPQNADQQRKQPVTSWQTQSAGLD